MLEDKSSAMQRDLKPLLLFLNSIEQCREHPDLPRLQPDELISIIDISRVTETGEVSPTLLIDGVLEPKGNHLFEEFLAVEFSVGLEVHETIYCNDKLEQFFQ